jgi:hypothetical protein
MKSPKYKRFQRADLVYNKRTGAVGQVASHRKINGRCKYLVSCQRGMFEAFGEDLILLRRNSPGVELEWAIEIPRNKALSLQDLGTKNHTKEDGE